MRTAEINCESQKKISEHWDTTQPFIPNLENINLSPLLMGTQTAQHLEKSFPSYFLSSKSKKDYLELCI